MTNLYATSCIRFSLNNSQLQLQFFGLEPLIINEQIAQGIMNSENRNYIKIEETPKMYKKKYIKGCLDGLENPKLLVIRFGGIGDVLWTTPALRGLKEKYPTIKIRFACFEKDRELLYNCPYIDELVTNHFPTVTDVEWADYVLDFFDSVEQTGTDEAKVRNPIDISCEWAGVIPSSYLPFIKVEDFESFRMQNLLLQKNVKKEDLKIHIPLTASSPHRTWVYQKELCEMILNKYPNAKIILTSNMIHSKDIAERVLGLKSDKIINLIGALTLRELIALSNEMDLTFTSDTGLVHICGGLGKKSVAIYTSVPRETRISHYPTVRGIQTKTECSPCYFLGEHCKYNELCCTSITAQDVFLELTKQLN